MVFIFQNLPCNFVGDFKVGDNIVYNARILCRLIEENDDASFNKMAVLQAGAIVEAALSEIIFRAQNFNREGVPTVSKQDRDEIATKQYDKLNSIIDCMKKYKMLDACSPDIYDELHKLRSYRNKVHIQSDIKDATRDEAELFSSEILKWALKLCFDVLSFLNANLARPANVQGYVAGLTLPVWSAT